jgi:methyl-accepting chemotaxis protein
MDHVTQSTAAQTEQVSATAQSLADQAGQLTTLVGRFRLARQRAAEAPDPLTAPVSLPVSTIPSPPRGRAAVGHDVQGWSSDLDGDFEEF